VPFIPPRHLRYARYARFGGSLRSPHHTSQPAAFRAAAGREGLIEASAEPRLVAHRHWSLFESMRCSDFVATRLETWAPEVGDAPTPLRSLLARTNTPRREADAPFVGLARAARERFFAGLRREVRETQRWRMDEHELFYPSFARWRGAAVPVMSAADCVHALSGLLQESADSALLESVWRAPAAPPAGGSPSQAVARALNWKDAWQNANAALHIR
jgi:hypothetical protein